MTYSPDRDDLAQRLEICDPATRLSATATPLAQRPAGAIHRGSQASSALATFARRHAFSRPQAETLFLRISRANSNHSGIG